ncbi:MAG: hypothetical protein ACRDKZ_12595 [Actinomycetota bacterium]
MVMFDPFAAALRRALDRALERPEDFKASAELRPERARFYRHEGRMLPSKSRSLRSEYEAWDMASNRGKSYRDEEREAATGGAPNLRIVR